MKVTYFDKICLPCCTNNNLFESEKIAHTENLYLEWKFWSTSHSLLVSYGRLARNTHLDFPLKTIVTIPDSLKKYDI